MSGWDVSSTPTWGPQDGPDETQAFRDQGNGSRDLPQDFGAQDFGRRGPSSPPTGFPEVGGGFPGESPAGGPPPEFFGQDYGQEHELGPGGFPQRTPGRSFQDLPRREPRSRHSSAPGGGAYGQDNAYGSDNAFGQESPFGQGGAFGQGDHKSGVFGQGDAFGQEWGGAGSPGADQAGTWGPGGQDTDGGWGRAAGRSAAPWEERPQPDSNYPSQDGQDFGQQDFGRQDYTHQAPRSGFAAQDYEGQELGGQWESVGLDSRDRDQAARMDPALQDFFAPQRGGTSGYPGQGPERSGEPRDSRFRPATDGWEASGRPQSPRGGTGPRPMPRGPRRDDPEPRRGLGMRGLIAIGAVVAVIIVIAVVLVTHKSGGGSPAASNTPMGGGTMTSAAAKPSASKAAGMGTGAAAAGTGTTTAAYTLSTPATAGGYPMGQDPHFLATATTTAKQITTAVASGGGGTASGTPVSAAYMLPASQVVTFVGYKGTFTPAKIETILASLGSDLHTYTAGPNGGILGCVNSTTTPSGAVCIWATSATLGITEFFTATGPETLNASQSKGAADTLKLRGDVEKKS